MSAIIKQIQQNLKDKGYRSSANRELVLKVLDKADRPLVISDIYERVAKLADKTSDDKVDQSTVYRIIEILSKEGYVKVVSLLEGFNRYELERGEQHHHHHFVCTECESITPVHFDEQLAASERQIEKEEGVTITSHSLEFFGVCKSCKLNP
jgi:Fur family ferric uptake transcriptional regulator